MKFNEILLRLLLLSLISILRCVDSQCEFTSHQNTNGFCTSDHFCCKGFSVNNLCSGNAICCYGSYDCSSDSNNSNQQIDLSCPTFVTRQQWKARNANKVIGNIAPVDHIFIHHSDDGNSCYSDNSCRARIRSLQSYHQLNKGWADIAWNFLIGIQTYCYPFYSSFYLGGNGLVYEGLGWNKEGFHTLSWNHISLGIVLIGNYNDEYPSNEILEALNSLISCGLRNGFILKTYKIHGHRDVRRTSCPGHNLYKYMQTMTNFESGPLQTPT